MHRSLAAFVALSLAAAPAFAGIVDSPLPAPFTKHVYSVPGVINDSGTSLVTIFSCTSTSTGPQTVGVELFAAAGGAALNNAATTALVVPVGGTVTFATAGVVFSDQTLGNPILSKGSARILSTSKSLICTAFVADSANTTPGSGWELTITAKAKQKGD